MRTYPAPLAFSLERESAHSDVYQLALLDDLGAVSEGPFSMRFSSPDEAVDWFASWTCVDVEKSPRRDHLRGLFDYRTSKGEAHVEAEIEEAKRLGAEIEEAEQLAQQVLAAGGRMVRFDVPDDLGDLRGGHSVAQWLRHCPHDLMNVEFENFEQPLVPHWTPSIVLPPRDDPWVVEMRAFDTDPRVYDLSLSVSRYASPVMGFSLWFSTPDDAVAWLSAVSHVDDVDGAVQSIVDQGGPVAARAYRTWPLLVRTVMHCTHERETPDDPAPEDPPAAANSSVPDDESESGNPRQLHGPCVVTGLTDDTVAAASIQITTDGSGRTWFTFSLASGEQLQALGEETELPAPQTSHVVYGLADGRVVTVRELIEQDATWASQFGLRLPLAALHMLVQASHDAGLYARQSKEPQHPVERLTAGIGRRSRRAIWLEYSIMPPVAECTLPSWFRHFGRWDPVITTNPHYAFESSLGTLRELRPDRVRHAPDPEVDYDELGVDPAIAVPLVSWWDTGAVTPKWMVEGGPALFNERLVPADFAARGLWEFPVIAASVARLMPASIPGNDESIPALDDLETWQDLSRGSRFRDQVEALTRLFHWIGPQRVVTILGAKAKPEVPKRVHVPLGQVPERVPDPDLMIARSADRCDFLAWASVDHQEWGYSIIGSGERSAIVHQGELEDTAASDLKPTRIWRLDDATLPLISVTDQWFGWLVSLGNDLAGDPLAAAYEVFGRRLHHTDITWTSWGEARMALIQNMGGGLPVTIVNLALRLAQQPIDPAATATATVVEALVGPGGEEVFALSHTSMESHTTETSRVRAQVEYRSGRGEWSEDFPTNTPQWAAEQVRIAQLYPSGSEPVPSDVIDRSACYRIQPQYSEQVVDLFDHEIPLSSHLAFLLTLDPDAEIDRAQLSGDQRRWVDDLVEQWRGYLGPDPEDVEGEPGGEQEYLWQHLSYLLDWTDSPGIPFTGADLCDVLLPVLGGIHGDGDHEPPEDAAMRWGPGE